MDLFAAAELNKEKRLIHKKDLQPINNLKTVFHEIRDYFAGNVTGITRDETIAQNIMRLLFCKIYDEKSKKEDDLVDFCNRPDESLSVFSKRINIIFQKVKSLYSDIFNQDEEIEIQALDLSFIVGKLEDFYLIDANRDIIADAFEELIGTAFRGGEGQFFTPRNVVQMMIDVLQPKSDERIIDPACGSGGFLAHILQYSLKHNLRNHIYGIDKDLFLSKLAKIYLTILGEDEYHIFCENSLEEPIKWNTLTQNHIQLNSFDLILTNPPFGAKIPVVGDDLLRQYELGHLWKSQKQEWILTRQLRDKQPPQILFIERIIQLLKEGGRSGIVLPEGVFGNPSDRYIWEYIRKVASVIGVVSLSHETFQPSTHTKTSVVFLEKKFSSRSSVFFAIANNIGHNKNGKATYKINDQGGFIFDELGNKIIDDDTPIIAQRFNLFLNNQLENENHLGFVVNQGDIRENVYVPESYKPEIKEKIAKIKESKKYKLIKLKDLIDQGIVKIKRGNEIGSQYYGTGDIPFVRTTDIVNWEIKMDTVKTVSENVYQKYKVPQNIEENDILFVNDGTFLIGRCSMVTKNDVKIVIQSHLRQIKVLKPDVISPFYLFYLLNTKFVQDQVSVMTFTQATLSTLGNRLLDILLPFDTETSKQQEIQSEVQYIIKQKADIKTRALKLNDIML